jgi:hypothetical protein
VTPPSSPVRDPGEPARVASTHGHILDIYETFYEKLTKEERAAIAAVRNVLAAVEDGSIGRRR